MPSLARLQPERFTVAERATDGKVVGFGQVKPLAGGSALELASLVVEPEERAKGLGAALVCSLVQRAGSTPVYAITISSRTPLYERCGFQQVPSSSYSQVPPTLLLESLAGSVVAWLAVQQRLVLLRLAADASSKESSSGTAQRQAAEHCSSSG